MVKCLKTFFFSWLLLWSQVAFSLDLQEQIDQLSNEEIEQLKNIDITKGVDSFLTDDPLVPLNDEDKEVLNLLGFTDQELEGMGAEDLASSKNAQKLQDGFSEYTNNKEKEVREGIFKQSVPGLAASVIGLGFASFLGIVVGVKCKSQPSALAFAASSAAWAGLELMNWNNYQLDMQKLKALGSSGKELKKLTALLQKIESRVTSIKPHINKLKSDETMEDGVNNIESQLSLLKNDIKELKVVMTNLDNNQIEALRSLTKSLELAADVTKKKSRNAKVAAIGYTAASGLAVMEGLNLFSGSGNCFTTAKNNKYRLFRESLEYLFPQSFALSVSIGDLDKMGIPIGAGGAAAYLAFEGQFANKIFASGWSRSAVFGIMAGTGYYASVKLKKAYDFLAAQSREVRTFTDFFDKRLKLTLENIDEPIDALDHAEKVIIPKAKELIAKYKERKAAINSADDILNTVNNIIDSAKDQTDTINSDQLEEIIEAETGQTVDEIKDEIQDAINTDLSDLGTDEFTSYLPAKKSFIDYLIPAAYASTQGKIRPSCFVLRPEVLKLDVNCRCQKTNSCTMATFKNIKANGQQPGSEQTILFAKEVMKANQLILTGSPSKGLARYAKLQKYAPGIERNTLKLLSQKQQKPMSFIPGVKQVHRTVASALKGYFERSGIPSYQKSSPTQTKTKEKKKFNPLYERIRNKVTLVKYLQGMPVPKRDDSRLKFKKSDFVSPLHGQAIQRDSSLNLFQIIKQRYLKIINDGRL